MMSIKLEAMDVSKSVDVMKERYDDRKTFAVELKWSYPMIITVYISYGISINNIKIKIYSYIQSVGAWLDVSDLTSQRVCVCSGGSSQQTQAHTH